jgi:hypothetical protein
MLIIMILIDFCAPASLPSFVSFVSSVRAPSSKICVNLRNLRTTSSENRLPDRFVSALNTTMKRTIRLLVYVLLSATFALTASETFAAKPPKSKKKPAYTPPPTPTPPPAPSVDLSKFVGTNMDKLLGPLEVKAPLPRAELAQLRASFAERFGKASLAERNQFQAALNVCDGLTQLMNEREKAALNPAAANWPVRSVQLKQWIGQLMAQEKAAETGAAAPAH